VKEKTGNEKTDDQRPRHARRYVFLLAFVIIALSVLHHPGGPFLPDETGFFFTGMDLGSRFVRNVNLIVNHDFDYKTWRDTRGNYGSVKPRVGIYVLGVIGHATAFIDDKPTRTYARRLGVALLSALCVVLFFQLACKLFSPAVGWVAAALLLINPIFRSVQVALLPDIPTLLFILAALVVLADIERDLRERNVRRKPYLLFGLFAGLAIACKLYAFALFVAFGIIVLIHLRAVNKRVVSSTLWAAVISIALFILSNPLLYFDLSDGLRVMTVDYMATLDRPPLTPTRSPLWYLAIYSVVIWQTPAFSLKEGLFIAPSDMGAMLLVMHSLLLFGAWRVYKKGLVLPLAWTLAAGVQIVFVLFSMNPGAMIPRMFLPVVTGTLLLMSVAFVELFNIWRDYRAKAGAGKKSS